MKQFSAVDNAFTKLKIKTYKVMLPILILATSVAIILEDLNNTNSIINQFILPILLVWLVTLFLLLLKMDPRKFRYFEYITLVLLSVIFLLKFWSTVHQFGIDGYYTLGEFFDWLPLFFIFIYFTFNGRKALSISLLFLGTTFLIACFDLVFNDFDRLVFSPIVQFHLSNIVYVIALYFLQKLKVVFLEADAHEKAANTDFLTNLPNRRYMHELLQNELISNNELLVILFDIDNFKKINDQYGHDIGDLVLVNFSTLIRDHLKDEGVLGRWGGEEFVIVAKNKNLHEGALLAEEIRTLLEKNTFDTVGKVTSSFGVTERRPGDVIHSILDRADKALYEAKDSGKNKVLIK